MTIAHVASVATGGAVNGVTSAAINTTGADLLVVVASWYDATTADVTLSDSKGNTWTALTKSNTPNVAVKMWYCRGGSVGSGHTFTASGTGTYSSIYAAAFSGSAATPFDQESGATGNPVTTLAAGSLTPVSSGCLVVAGVVAGGGGGAPAPDGGFSAQAVTFSSGNYMGCGGAYLVQTTAAAANPAWTWGGASIAAAARLATFTPAPSATAHNLGTLGIGG